MNQVESMSLSRLISLILICVFSFGNAIGQELKNELPKEKQTTLELYVTSSEAFNMWVKDSNKIKIIDVRTPEEYVFIGHAEMAYNIPLFFHTHIWDPSKNHYSMERNVDFMNQVKENFSIDEVILVTCRSGGRSAMAVNQLAEAGYKNVYNIIDGFEGDKVTNHESINFGKRKKNGWINSDLPWTYSLIEEQVIIKEIQNEN